jgi:hypothetical protein
MCLAFLDNCIWLPLAEAQLSLSKPGQRIALSQSTHPPVLRGLKVFANKPLSFDFILDQGSLPLAGRVREGDLKKESTKLIRYFLAGLTVPQGDLWVNLSPYEKNRIVPHPFGQTEMGRDLLAQDYVLKQITASVIYPESETGKQFWAKVYAQAQKQFHTTKVPVNTFNKVWIVPDKAVVYEGPMTNGQATVYVTEAKLKVMLEQDYLSLQKVSPPLAGGARGGVNTLGSQIIRQIILPILEKEINEGSNFSTLRQIYHSLILATWYKKKIKKSLLAKQYTDQNKVAGLQYKSSVIARSEATKQSSDQESIYQQYLQSFKKGAYSFIKEESDPVTGQAIRRKYFSGGAKMDISLAMTSSQPKTPDYLQIIHADFNSIDVLGNIIPVSLENKKLSGQPDHAMSVYFNELKEKARQEWSQKQEGYRSKGQPTDQEVITRVLGHVEQLLHDRPGLIQKFSEKIDDLSAEQFKSFLNGETFEGKWHKEVDLLSSRSKKDGILDKDYFTQHNELIDEQLKNFQGTKQEYQYRLALILEAYVLDIFNTIAPRIWEDPSENLKQMQGLLDQLYQGTGASGLKPIEKAVTFLTLGNFINDPNKLIAGEMLGLLLEGEDLLDYLTISLKSLAAFINCF